MVIPQPQQREATDRPLLPAEHNALKQLVTKLAAATGEPSKQIWQSMLELSGVKDGELIPAKLFNHLVTWLQARQTLSQQNTPTLETLQMALKQPLDASELAALSAYIQQKYGLSAQSSLSSAQAEDILNQLYRYRHISSKNMAFLRNHRFLLPRPRIFLISFINGGLKGLSRVICNRCFILFHR